MKVNPLPPQAYTKETLQKAYAWLLTQSASVKDMASTQDILVSLYLKAQRNGEASLETPSIQNFKKELKNIASMMTDLQPAAEVNTAKSTPVLPPIENDFSIETPFEASALTSKLDPQSLQALVDVKTTLNLSSEAEALRALIALGYKQFKKMN